MSYPPQEAGSIKKEELKMAIAVDMMKITENIIASHDMRVKARSDLVHDTRKKLKLFGAERKRMGKEQVKALSDFVSDLTSNVRDLLNELKNARIGMSVELRTKLEKEVTDLKNYTNNKLEKFSVEHADMSKELREGLFSYVDKINKGVSKLLNEYASDMKKARVAWKGISKSLKKAREADAMSRGETV